LPNILGWLTFDAFCDMGGSPMKLLAWLGGRPENIERGEAGQPFLSPGWGGRIGRVPQGQ
jgi:hypothetical protein